MRMNSQFPEPPHSHKINAEDFMTGEENPEYQNDKRKDEKVGWFVFWVYYAFRALSVIIPVSLISWFVLRVVGKPLWIAPLIGILAWIIVRGIWILVFRVFYKLMNL